MYGHTRQYPMGMRDLLAGVDLLEKVLAGVLRRAHLILAGVLGSAHLPVALRRRLRELQKHTFFRTHLSLF